MRPPSPETPTGSISLPSPLAAASPSTTEEPAPFGPPQQENYNLLVLAGYQILLRIGWIFKTESIIMPAFLDAIAGAGWVRGFLPALNRFGQSVPPVLMADRLRRMPHKKWALVACQVGMALVFLSLSLIWWMTDGTRVWMPACFLALYTLFFSCTGLAQLASGTLQGKLVRPNRRGRLLLISASIGSIVAIGFVWWLLAGWLALPNQGFHLIFGFTGGFFLLAALMSTQVREFADTETAAREHDRGRFREAWDVLRDDRNFRRLAIVAALFGAVVILFPHYQALARTRLDAGMSSLMIWVIAQHAGVGVLSIFVGPLADRRGNRLVLRLVLLASAVTPVLAIVLSRLPDAAGAPYYWSVFLLLGITPVTFRTLVNYTLEISRTADHPKYLSTLNLCLAAPFITSPLVGLLVDLVGFEAVLLTGGALIICGAVISFTLIEPREQLLGVEAPADSPLS